MPIYFFDTRDNEHLITDDVGLELTGLLEARDQAAVSLAELAHDVLPGNYRRDLSVDVRDALHPVLRAALSFEAVPLLE
jgi:hypothetical protein